MRIEPIRTSRKPGKVDRGRMASTRPRASKPSRRLPVLESKPRTKEARMSIKKQFLKSKPICRVTFRIPKPVANDAARAYLVGEFNNWSLSANPMKRLKNGEFTATVDLEKDREYQFRYLVGDKQWENEPESDRFAQTPFQGTLNSVIVV